MSLFGHNYRELPGQIDKEEIRSQIKMAQVVSFLGMEWDRGKRLVKCPRHAGGNEKTPSAQVNENTLYCHACRMTWDIFSVTQERMGIPFREAVEYLAVNLGNIPAADQVTARSAGADYAGPAPIDLVRYWHTLLTAEHRQWLHEARWLTDQTINAAGIGWRPESRAYSIPYWRGEPWHSDVDIVQFRASPERLADDPDMQHYWGLTGHNRPSWINGHRIGRGYLVIFFGTLDALLAGQDGLTAISINGATTFMRDPDNIARLRKAVEGAWVFVVPDKTASEFKAAYALAQDLGAEVRHFPHDAVGKDYTEYRQAGKTVVDFIEEVLMLESPWPKENGNDRQIVIDMLIDMAEGRAEQAGLKLVDLREKGYMPQVICHEMQFLSCFEPSRRLTASQWEKAQRILETSLTWEKLALFIDFWVRESENNLGGF